MVQHSNKAWATAMEITRTLSALLYPIKLTLLNTQNYPKLLQIRTPFFPRDRGSVYDRSKNNIR